MLLACEMKKPRREKTMDATSEPASEPVDGCSVLEQSSPAISSKRRCRRNVRRKVENEEGRVTRSGSMPGRTRALSFTKVLTGKCAHHSDYCCRLSLPRRFCEDHGVERHVTMTDSTGRRLWHMRFQARRASMTYTISNGWREFSYDHGLERGDALVFTLLSPSHFAVVFANDDGSRTRAMRPRRDGEGQYPWKINYSRIACLSRQKISAANVIHTVSKETIVHSSEDGLQDVKKATVVHSSEDRLQGVKKATAVHSSEDRLQGVKNKPSIALPNVLCDPREEKMQFCQCKTFVAATRQMSSKLPEFTHLECKKPDGTTYLQVFDSDSEIADLATDTIQRN